MEKALVLDFSTRPTSIPPAPADATPVVGAPQTPSTEPLAAWADSATQLPEVTVPPAPITSTAAMDVCPADSDNLAARPKRRRRGTLAMLLAAIAAAGACLALDGRSLRWAMQRIDVDRVAHSNASAFVPAESAPSPHTTSTTTVVPETGQTTPEPTSTSPATSTAPPALDALPDASAVAQQMPPGMGMLKTDGATRGRRIFVDRRTMGQTPQPVLVTCGPHEVKIGSAGRTIAIDVPCAGEITLGDH